MTRTGRGASSLLGLLFSLCANASAQTSDSAGEFWPRLNTYYQLPARLRLQGFVGGDETEDSSYRQFKVGGQLSHPLKPIHTSHLSNIDQNKEHHLALDVGYEYLDTTSGGSGHENRAWVQATPSLRPAARLFVADRNRLEFRWKNGEYSTRYRNKLTVELDLQTGGFRFTPYAAGEVFYESAPGWYTSQISVGVQMPYQRLVMMDTYYLRQDCNTCSPRFLNVWGLTLNLYLRNGS